MNSLLYPLMVMMLMMQTEHDQLEETNEPVDDVAVKPAKNIKSQDATDEEPITSVPV